MLNRYKTYFKWINVFVDYSLLNLALIFALYINDLYPVAGDLPENYKLNFLLLNLFWFYCSKLIGLYENVLNRDAGPTMMDTLFVLLIYFITACVLMVTFPSLSFTFKFNIEAIFLASIFILIWKFNYLALRRSKRKFWVDYTSIVITGAGPVGVNIAKYMHANPQLGYKVIGFFDDKLTGEKAGFPILGKVDTCIDYVTKSNIAEIYCALPNTYISTIKSMMQQADKYMVRFKMMPDINDLLEQNILTGAHSLLPVLTSRLEPLESKANEILKRLFDMTFSIIVILFVLSWLIPLIGIIIKLTSKGSVFFKQLRSGKNNKPFYCYKFRSMTLNADSDSRQAVKGDMRVTKVGAFLRKSSIDELPQFFNVMMGDMSVVGPRPHMIKHTVDYSAEIDTYMVRHFLTPGITGWAQINGYRGETKETSSMVKRVQADIWYLENWSLLLDIKIVFLTMWQAIRGNQNAY